MCVPTTARRHRCETCTPRAARATRSSYPATAGREPAPGRAYVCRHRRVAIAARPARPAQLTRRVRPPRPRPAESQRRAARVCCHQRRQQVVYAADAIPADGLQQPAPTAVTGRTRGAAARSAAAPPPRGVNHWQSPPSPGPPPSSGTVQAAGGAGRSVSLSLTASHPRVGVGNVSRPLLRCRSVASESRVPEGVSGGIAGPDGDPLAD